MIERRLRSLWLTGVAFLTAATFIALELHAPMAAGLCAGATWNLVNLTCLAGLLHACITPQSSKRWAIAWFVVKFPLLYAIGYQVLRRPDISILGFGIGFTLMLLLVLGWFTFQIPYLLPVRSHGR